MDEKVRRGEDRTDWERLRNMTDEEVEASIDFEDEGHFEMTRLMIGRRAARGEIQPSVDLDVLDWFRQRGPGYEDELHDVLRAYIPEHQRQAS